MQSAKFISEILKLISSSENFSPNSEQILNKFSIILKQFSQTEMQWKDIKEITQTTLEKLNKFSLIPLKETEQQNNEQDNIIQINNWIENNQNILFNLALIILQLGEQETYIRNALNSQNFKQLIGITINNFENLFSQDCPRIQHLGNCLKKMLGLQEAENYSVYDIQQELFTNKIISLSKDQLQQQQFSFFANLLQKIKSEFQENQEAGNLQNSNRVKKQIVWKGIQFIISIQLIGNSLHFIVLIKSEENLKNNIQNYIQLYSAKYNSNIFEPYERFKNQKPQKMFNHLKSQLENQFQILESSVPNKVVMQVEKSKTQLIIEEEAELLQFHMKFELLVPPLGNSFQDINFVFKLSKVNLFNLEKRYIIDKDIGENLIQIGGDINQLGSQTITNFNKTQEELFSIEQEIKSQDELNTNLVKSLKMMREKLESLKNEQKQLS